MITQLKIENYKSIQELTLDVGRVNVLIGENGCGKSNILEAITFAAAAEADRLDNEFLRNRGIRVTEPELMRSAFEKKQCKDDIKINFSFNKFEEVYTLKNDNDPYSKWTCNEVVEELKRFKKILSTGIHIDDERFFKNYDYNYNHEDELHVNELENHFYEKKEIKKFMLYSPNEFILRGLNDVKAIEPLGVYGEGLLKLLIVTQHEAQHSEQLNQESERFNDLQETLELFDWYESIEIPNDFPLLENKLILKDRYLEINFDTKNVNEGFLLVLFYITLVVSKYTPKIFAIDNIDTSLNPKLCSKLIEELARLAKKYDKQIFLTSHNPAILDGIDLADEEQRLFVVFRNKQGHTRCKRIDLTNKPRSASDEPLKLSEAFVSGYLGGLPKGF
jgi:predicted ATPase